MVEGQLVGRRSCGGALQRGLVERLRHLDEFPRWLGRSRWRGCGSAGRLSSSSRTLACTRIGPLKRALMSSAAGPAARRQGCAFMAHVFEELLRTGYRCPAGSRPTALKMSMTSALTTALLAICRSACSFCSSPSFLPEVPNLVQRGLHRLQKGQLIPMARAPRQACSTARTPLLAASTVSAKRFALLQAQDVIRHAGQLPRRVREGGVVEAVQHTVQHIHLPAAPPGHPRRRWSGLPLPWPGV